MGFLDNHCKVSPEGNLHVDYTACWITLQKQATTSVSRTVQLLEPALEIQLYPEHLGFIVCIRIGS